MDRKRTGKKKHGADADGEDFWRWMHGQMQ